MKNSRIFLFVILFSVITSICFAYNEAYEPEDNDAVSFSSYSVEGGNAEITFVNYVTKDNVHEYWMRLANGWHHTKLLNYITLSIDDVPYNITAIPNPSEKYSLAGQTLIDNSNNNGFMMASKSRSGFRYYSLSPEIAQKLQSAKKVYFIYNMVSHVNIHVNIPEKFLNNIKKMYAFSYADFAEHWKPDGVPKSEATSDDNKNNSLFKRGNQ